MLKNLFLLIVPALIFSTAAQSQVVDERQDAPTAASTSTATEAQKLQLELSMGAQSLSNGYGDWKDLTLRSTYSMNQHVLKAEVSRNQRFNQNGLFAGASDTYTFNDDWYGSLAAGVGDGAFYLPRYRVDGAIYRKMLPERNLVGSIGAGYYRAPDGHTDRSLSLGVSYYFASPWVLEGGVRFNDSLPGSINTQQQFVAATYGRDKHDLVTARYGWGKEGYLAIAVDSQLVNFRSSEASLSWRHWFNPNMGLVISATHYTNPTYHRSGLNVGLFQSN